MRDTNMRDERDWKLFNTREKYFAYYAPQSAILELTESIWLELRDWPNQELLKTLEMHFAPSKLPPPNEHSISHIALNVAERCNMRCTYCYAGDGDYGKDSLMSLETAIKAVRFFYKEGRALFVSFFGGEPLLNFRLIQDLVELCAKENWLCHFSVTTNGLLMTSEHVAFFKKHKFQVKISYDGNRLQKLQRSPQIKISETVKKKLQRFEKDLHELRSIEIRGTVSAEHLETFFQDLQHSLESLSYKIQYTRVASSVTQLAYTEEDILKLGASLQTLVHQLLEKKLWPQLLRLSNLKNYMKDIHWGQLRPFCGAGLNYLSVSTQGEFFLCHRFTEDRAESLGDLETGLNRERIRQIKEFRQLSHKSCQNCWMRKVCHGGCFHEHKMAKGSIFELDPLFCRLQDIEMTEALKIYVCMKAEAASLLSEAMK